MSNSTSNSTDGASESVAAAKAASMPLTAGWVIFVTGMSAAAAVDVMLVSRPSLPGSWPVFAKQIAFWLISGMLFMIFVWEILGSAAAGSWLYGYFLEYTLSIDNLFVFQLIFKAYSTPENQVERGLFWGISGAVVLRLLFFAVGTEILAMGLGARIIFGLVLVYSGVKTLWESDDDEEDSDPSQNVLVRCISALLPVHDNYCEEPSFLVRVPRSSADASSSPPPTVLGSTPDGKTKAKARDLELATMMDVEDGAHDAPEDPSSSREVQQGRESESNGTAEDANARGAENNDSAADLRPPTIDHVLKVTPLLLVVLSLGIIDVVFAVDSVTAKISSVQGFKPEVSFFLNLTSSAFAMFVLRSLYMVVDMLTDMFRFLKYGVGTVLVLIGIKLMLAGYFEVSMLHSSGAILTILAFSVLASILFPENKSDDSAPTQEDGRNDGQDDAD
eukprot:TRINITY_DN11125_c0_g1_i1.p1 TRINITY_DN11125_c0_g1~~TRINITY_DN11125_c0_g1_i1.p1  ORF type:complete len:447 (+),score=73.61 TRINITY_DN11125_c0_g1_i1:58-1398(+)